MAEKSFPWDSNNGDRKYKAEDFASIFRLTYNDGIFRNAGNALAVVAGTGMTIKIKTGSAMINGTKYENDEELTKTLSLGNSIYNRDDRVVLRWDKTTRTVTIEVLEGTPASTPTYPAITRNDSVWDLVLADVTVKKGATSITQSSIRNRRGFDNYAPWVDIRNDASTDALFSQYETAWQETIDKREAEYNNFKGLLTGDVGTNLSNAITEAQEGETSLKNNLNKNYVKKNESGMGDVAPVYDSGSHLRKCGVYQQNIGSEKTVVLNIYNGSRAVFSGNYVNKDRMFYKSVEPPFAPVNLLDEKNNLRLSYDQQNDNTLGGVDIVLELANGIKEIMGWITVPPISEGAGYGGRFYEIPTEQANYTRCINLQATPLAGQCSFQAYHTVRNGKKCIAITYAGSNDDVLQFAFRMIVQ